MPTPKPDISPEDFWLAAHRAWRLLSDKDLERTPTPVLAEMCRTQLDRILAEKENSK